MLTGCGQQRPPDTLVKNAINKVALDKYGAGPEVTFKESNYYTKKVDGEVWQFYRYTVMVGSLRRIITFSRSGCAEIDVNMKVVKRGNDWDYVIDKVQETERSKSFPKIFSGLDTVSTAIMHGLYDAEGDQLDQALLAYAREKASMGGVLDTSEIADIECLIIDLAERCVDGNFAEERRQELIDQIQFLKTSTNPAAKGRREDLERELQSLTPEKMQQIAATAKARLQKLKHTLPYDERQLTATMGTNDKWAKPLTGESVITLVASAPVSVTVTSKTDKTILFRGMIPCGNQRDIPRRGEINIDAAPYQSLVFEIDGKPQDMPNSSTDIHAMTVAYCCTEVPYRNPTVTYCSTAVS
jgi:hypothetical protein